MFMSVFTAWLRLTAVAMLLAVWSCDYRTVATIYMQLRVYWCGRESKTAAQRQRARGAEERGKKEETEK